MPEQGAADVLIIGASVAGLATAEGLRRRGFDGTIMMVGAERHLPYDKPPLSKKLLDQDWTPESARLRKAEHYGALGVELRLGSAAVGFDAARRTVVLADASVLTGHHVVLATGAHPRGLDASPDVPTVRGLDDAILLRRQLAAGRRLAVVGGGFVGVELAAAAVRHGVDVTLVEAAAYPLAPVLGAAVGHALAAAHTRRGLRLACGVQVERVANGRTGQTVILADGRSFAADVVVAGLGVTPTLGWLEGSGLDLDDGVVCDASGRTCAERVYAAGDVASWYEPCTGEHVRSQHWTAAREQGMVVADVIRGADQPARPSAAPYFWSDQADLRIQSYGRLERHDNCELVWGDYDDERFVVRYYRVGRLAGVLGVNAARELRRHYTDVVEAAREDAVLAG